MNDNHDENNPHMNVRLQHLSYTKDRTVCWKKRMRNEVTKYQYISDGNYVDRTKLLTPRSPRNVPYISHKNPYEIV